MEVVISRPLELGEQERARWRSFQERELRLRNPFLSPTFARELDIVDDRTRVAVVSDAQEIIGFLPFTLRRGGVASTLAPNIAGAQAFVHDPRITLDLREIIRACRLSVFELDHFVRDETVVVPEGRTQGRVSNIIDISCGYEQYLTDLHARHKRYENGVRRKRQRLEAEHGPITFASGVADHRSLDTLIAWKSAQYRRSGWPDPFAKRWLVELLHRLIEIDEPDLAGRLSTLWVGDHLLAADMSPHSPEIYAAWFIAYNLEFSTFSPGALNTLCIIEMCANLGIEYIDLGTGDESFKETLSTGSTPLVAGPMSGGGTRAALYNLARLPRAKTIAFILGHHRVRSAVRSTLRGIGSIRERVLADST